MIFFAAIRLILSKESGPDMLNAVAHDIIKKHILPQLMDEAKSGDPKSVELVKMYEDYTGTGARAEIFGTQAFNVIRTVAARYNLDEHGIDDLLMKFVEDMYRRSSWNLLLRDERQWRSIVQSGPESFAKWFAGVVRLDAMSNARDVAFRTTKELEQEPKEEDGESPLENIPDKPSDPWESLVSEEVQRDLREFLRRTFKKPVYLELFDAWMDAIDRYGTTVNARQHVLPVISDKTGIPKGTLYGYMTEIRRALGKFFSREYNLRVPVAASSGMGITERLVCAEYRRRMAGWVLSGSPVLRLIMEAR